MVKRQQFGLVGQGGPGPRNRLRREPTGGVDSLAQAHYPGLTMHIVQLSARQPGSHVGDQQANRVGTAVDRGDPG